MRIFQYILFYKYKYLYWYIIIIDTIVQYIQCNVITMTYKLPILFYDKYKYYYWPIKYLQCVSIDINVMANLMILMI